MVRIATLLVCLLSVVGCSSDSDRLYVSAAASLADVFVEIEAEFEANHPDIDLVLNFGGSTTLGYQIAEGAPIDVFASANFEPLHELGVDQDAEVFATNRLQLVVPDGNRGGITDLESLASGGLLVGACDSSVPCGELADRVLTEADVSVEFTTREPNVTSVLTKVASGELDAGLVYVTDIADGASSIEIESDLSNEYPIVSISESPMAEVFIAFVLSDVGRGLLLAAGFGAP